MGNTYNAKTPLNVFKSVRVAKYILELYDRDHIKNIANNETELSYLSTNVRYATDIDISTKKLNRIVRLCLLIKTK